MKATMVGPATVRAAMVGPAMVMETVAVGQENWTADKE